MQGTAANGIIEAKVNDDGYKDLGDWMAYLQHHVQAGNLDNKVSTPAHAHTERRASGDPQETYHMVCASCQGEVDGEYGHVGVRCGILAAMTQVAEHFNLDVEQLYINDLMTP
jgi:hypothetical protein